MATPTDHLAQQLRSQLLQLNEMVAPLHEWLQGEYTYFLQQGYTEQQARAMSAATYVSVFGPALGKPDA